MRADVRSAARNETRAPDVVSGPICGGEKAPTGGERRLGFAMPEDDGARPPLTNPFNSRAVQTVAEGRNENGRHSPAPATEMSISERKISHCATELSNSKIGGLKSNKSVIGCDKNHSK